jgi:hypothetical protein
MFRCFIPLILVLAVAAQESAVGNHTQSRLRISGTVVNAITGQPLKDVEVATGPVLVPGGQKTKTGNLGHFAFEKLSKGKYWLIAQGRGFPRQSYDEHENFSSAVVVGSEDIPSEGIVFRLHPGAAISGLITDNFNDPVRNASVTLFRTGVFDGKQTTATFRQATSDDRGYYHFSHLPAGNYLIAVSAQPWYAHNEPHVHVVSTTTRNADGSVSTNTRQVEQPSGSRSDPLDVAYPLTFYPSVTDAGSAALITIKPGDQTAADVTLSAVPAAHIRLPQNGQTQNISYSLSEHVFGDSLQIPVQTFGMNGEMEIAGIAPGHFMLDAQTNGPNPVRASQEINVLENGEIAEEKVSPSVAVSGIVTMEGNPAFQRVYVQIRSANAAYGSQVAETGEFQIEQPVDPGSYEVFLAGISGGAVVSVTRDNLPPVAGNKIEIGGSNPVRLQIRLSRGLGRVEGVAVKDGKPCPGVMVVLVPDDLDHHLSFARRDQSDGDGTFLLDRAVPGRYKVVAIQNGWDLEWSNPAVLKPYLKTAEPFEISANQKYTIKVPVQ